MLSSVCLQAPFRSASSLTLGPLYRSICHHWGHGESRQFGEAGRHPWQWDHSTFYSLCRNGCCHLSLWLKPQERPKDWWMPVWLLFRACCWSPPFGASPEGNFLGVCAQGGLSLCLSDVSPGWCAPGLSWRQQKCPGTSWEDQQSGTSLLLIDAQRSPQAASVVVLPMQSWTFAGCRFSPAWFLVLPPCISTDMCLHWSLSFDVLSLMMSWSPKFVIVWCTRVKLYPNHFSHGMYSIFYITLISWRVSLLYTTVSLLYDDLLLKLSSVLYVT